MSLPFVQRSWWIWSAEGTHAAPAPGASSPSHYQVRLFRRVFNAEPGAVGEVHVTGDSRYLLFCNGECVARGPARGDITHHFYETCDLGRHLRPGRNVLAALVLDMSRVAHRPTDLGAPCAIMTYAGGFLLEGEISTAGGGTERLDTGLPGWKVRVDTSRRFQNEGTRFEGYHGYFEHRRDAEAVAGWEAADFDDAGWPEATRLFLAERIENRRDPTSPYGLQARMIPALEEGPPEAFREAFVPGGGAVGSDWDALLARGETLTIPARTETEVILDVGELTTAYPRLRTAGGAGAVVRLTYAEALRLPWTTPGARLLGRPQSLANLASHYADEANGWTFDRRGAVTGWSDVWEPAGRRGGETFEPWHWRAFRYVGVRIRTGEEPLELREVRHRFTAYPYDVRGRFRASDARLDGIWRVALRTMRLCSHETFEDCPHYEQMQYAGDTMITSKIALLTTGDGALTRQALHQFDWSRLPDGLTHSRYPSRLLQVIPSWSLHWITCIRDYAYCVPDVETPRALLPGVRAVLDWFRRHADDDGLPARLPYWNITDWCPWWPRGVVPGADTGPTCIIAAQFIHALAEAADLARIVGRKAEAEALELEAEALRGVLHRRFWSETEGLYLDRPGGPEVSQYGNAWAVVCGAAGERERRRLLERFPSDPKLAPGSFFCWHAVFRALELSGAYDRMPAHLGPWQEMVDYGLDTFVEENSYWRSLCHAWSAHPSLEFLTRILGVNPAAPGFGRIRVQPHRCGLTWAEGSVCTPRGPVEVRWTAEGGRFRLEGRSPAGVPVDLILPGGLRREHTGGRFEIEETSA
jgi:alpha-L-rhamnosidase